LSKGRPDASRRKWSSWRQRFEAAEETPALVNPESSSTAPFKGWPAQLSAAVPKLCRCGLTHAILPPAGLGRDILCRAILRGAILPSSEWSDCRLGLFAGVSARPASNQLFVAAFTPDLLALARFQTPPLCR
jgi:hypothetical protein